MPLRSLGLAGVFVCFGLAPAALAQTQFSTLGTSQLPGDLDDTQSVVSGDFDGDGDQDLIVGNDGPDRLYLNDGGGVFADGTAGRLPTGTESTVGLALGDLDGDGDLDVVGVRNNSPVLLLNNGNAVFSAATFPALTTLARGLALLDADQDGDLDLMLATDGQSALFQNDGSAGFSDVTASAMPVELEAHDEIEVLDFDGDGSPDVLIGSRQGFSVYRNDGSGVFLDETLTRLPGALGVSAMAVADVDLDGDVDCFLAEVDPAGPVPFSTPVIYLNDGAGLFSELGLPGGFVASGPSIAAAEFTDLDGDSDPELVIGHENTLVLSPFVEILVNQGAMTFPNAIFFPAFSIPVVSDRVQSILSVDVDGDLDQDLLVGTLESADAVSNRLLLNDGSLRLTDTSAPSASINGLAGLSAVSGDWDGDGNTDLAVINGEFIFQPTTVDFFRNTGRDQFELLGTTFLGGTGILGGVPSAVSGDFDQDGDVDVVISFPSAVGRSQAYLVNNGAGGFGDLTAGRIPDLGPTGLLEIVDVEGDGDLDLVVGGISMSPILTPSRLLLNDGAAFFTESSVGVFPTADMNVSGIAVGDLDGDDSEDIVLVENGSNALVLINDGLGVYSDEAGSRLPAGLLVSQSVALGDLDNDGDQDLVLGTVASIATPADRQDRILINDGLGVFTDQTASRFPIDLDDDTFTVELVDVDDDGDSDLIRDSIPSLYLNNGTGVFSAALPSAGPAVVGRSPVVADLDGDGDPDVFQPMGNPEGVSFNLYRHADASTLLRIGRNYRLDLYAAFNPPISAVIAVPIVGFDQADISIAPFGRLLLNPATAVVLPLVAIPPSSGFASVSLSIPDLSPLLGLTFYSQALFGEVPTGRLRLSSGSADVFRR